MITNVQKAVILAKYDGWDYNPDRWNEYHRKFGQLASDGDLASLYLTDLNSLIPLAVRLQKEGTIYCQQFHYDTPEYHYFSAIVNKITT
jgi:hypothetical protein